MRTRDGVSISHRQPSYRHREIHTSYRDTWKASTLWANRPTLAARSRGWRCYIASVTCLERAGGFILERTEPCPTPPIYFQAQRAGRGGSSPTFGKRKKSKCWAELRALLLVRTLEAAALRAHFTFPPSPLTLRGHRIHLHTRTGHGQAGWRGGG